MVARSLLALLVSIVVAAGLLAVAKPVEAAFPGNNGRIAFASNRDGNNEIYSVSSDGTGAPTNLTNNSVSDYEPAFSADGTKIAFTRFQDNNYEIYAMSADGSNQLRLTRDTTTSVTDYTPVFSPDGTKIAFVSNRDGDRDVYVMNADGSDQINLVEDASNPVFDGEPTFSPDGTKIAFTSNRDDDYDVYVMNADGSDQVSLIEDGANPASDYDPAFSPDGEKIVFASDRDGDSDVYVMGVDGSGQTSLTDDAVDTNIDQDPAFSPDGQKIAFETYRDGDYDIYTMSANGSGTPTSLTEDTASPVSDYDPDWGALLTTVNDDFARASTVTGGPASISGTTVDATREDDEPEHYPSGSQVGEHSVWYRYTPEISGGVALDTCTAEFDTILSVYTGSAVGSLTRVADDNDSCSDGSGSELSFDAEADTTYYVAVSGAGSAEQGTFTLGLDLLDNVAPDTTIDSDPLGTTNANPESFEFSSNEPGASFECRLDNEDFSVCVSPKTYTGLSNGSHTFEVKATDATGNVDDTPASSTWTVDATAPSAPAITSPVNNSYTADGDVTLSGTAEAGSIVDVFDGEISQGTTQANTDGEWSKALSGVADGSHSYTATARDAVGNTSAASDPLTVIMDTAMPETTIDSGPSGTVGSDPASFEFSSEAGATFECSLDDGAFESCTSPKEYPSNDLDDGSHTFEVKATDAAGNTGPAASRTWTVDTEAPSAPAITSPANNSYDTDGNITLSGTAEANSTVEFFDGTTPKGTTTADASGNWSETLPDVSEGSHTYAAKATDAAGNASDPSVAVTVTVDKTAPGAPEIDSPDDDSYDTDGSITVSGTAESGSTVQLFDGDAEVGEATADSDGNFSIGLNSVPDGPHTYRATATDAAGNESDDSGSVTVTVDAAAPGAPIITAPTDGSYDKDGNITVSGTAEPISTVEVFEGSASVGEATADGNGNYSVQLNNVSEGGHTYTARATDAAGNESESSEPVTVTVDKTAPDAPEITSPDDGSYDNDGAIIFSGTAEAGSSVELFEGLVSKATADSSGVWSLDLPGVLEGEHTYAARATDRAGNASAGSEDVTVTVDKTAPETSITSGPSGTVVSGSASFGFSSEAGASFECEMDGGQFAPCSSPEDYVNLTDGQHTFRVRAIDAAGNADQSPAQRDFTVDTTAPSAPVITAPVDNSYDTDGDVTISGDAEANSTVEIFDGTASKGTAQAGSGGNWIKALTGVSEGSHTYTAKATDGAGNTSAASNARTVTVDTSAPETEITSGPEGTVDLLTADFEFSSETGATFKCSLDGGVFGDCSSPKRYTGMTNGSHTFQVRATDAAGNTDESPASRDWTVSVDSAPTITPVSPAQGAQVKAKKILVKATVRDTPSNPERSGIRLYMDNKEVTTFSYNPSTGEISYTIKKAKAGSHAVRVVATDAVGNSTTGNWTFQVAKKKKK